MQTLSWWHNYGSTKEAEIQLQKQSLVWGSSDRENRREGRVLRHIAEYRFTSVPAQMT